MYRRKLIGVTASVSHIKILCQKYDITEDSITVGLDSEKALKSYKEDSLLHAKQKDQDLIHHIQRKRKVPPIKIKWKWIKGYQDDSITYKNLDTISQLNVDTNQLEKDHWVENCHLQLQTSQLSKKDWGIKFKRKKLVLIDKPLLYQFLT